jgi:hypothetical protein
LSAEPIRALPARPSKEHLRKEAKYLAKARRLGLAEAQRKVAAAYGFGTWAAMIHRVDELRGGRQPAVLPPFAAAAQSGDVAAVRRLLMEGASVDEVPPRGTGAALWQACASDAPDEARLAIVDALLVAGANPRRDGAGETALHAAAARGPLALVERLIRGEALEWQPDSEGRPAVALARAGEGRDKAAIIELLDRPVIRDPSFRAAVTAIHRGDAAGLARLLDAEPRLLRESIVEPECYRAASRFQYFRDPRLFWFIANNPTLVERMPSNMAEIARTMIDRSVDRADRGRADDPRPRRRSQWLHAGPPALSRCAPGGASRRRGAHGSADLARRPDRHSRQDVEQHAARLGDPPRQDARPGLPRGEGEESGMTLRIATVRLFVDDMAAARAFHGDLLDLTPMRQGRRR